MVEERIVKRLEVESMTGLSRSTIYAKMAEDTFPKQHKLSKRSVGWLYSDIQGWIADITQAPKDTQ
jgi:prophage regulatory protein